MRRLQYFLKDCSGTTAIEYSIMGALVAIAIVGGATALSGSLNTTFTAVGDKVEAAVK